MRILLQFAVVVTIAAGIGLQSSAARDIHISISKRSEATPVQKLNRDGVKEIQKHHLRKAEKLFYKAYLIDPDDPFTLNNLGYLSELQGKVERAQRYYQLAAKENNSETVIASATERSLKGKKLSEVTGSYGNLELRINRGNVLAMSLLQQGRSLEAEQVLRDTLKLAPRNPFTLNNLGYALETQGDLDSALRYYNEASVTHSTEPIVVAIDARWRGKPIGEIASRNAQSVRDHLASAQSSQDRAARYNAQGVSALNHNDSGKALNYFEQAYKLDPQNAFSLNNMGYVAEARGDEETADEFYSLARHGDQAGTAVNTASHHEMVGEAVGNVASTNSQASEASLQAEAEARRRRHAPIVLKRRDNRPISVPAPEAPQTQTPPQIDNAPVENTVPRPPQ